MYFELLSREQTRLMADSGLVTIGSHTVSHSLLGSTAPQDAAWELAASRREIEERLGRACRAFCYPNGTEGDFNVSTE